ncbi:MAG: hypothetical protein GEU90_20205 [Gemmatimonas sp.]|nr:hypothetical protein [Gemmatimonas sp.]
MNMKRVGLLGCAVALVLGLSQVPLEATWPVHELVVRGEGVCGTAGPVGRYTLRWTVVNPEVNGETTIVSATESGAYEGTVSIEPNPLPAGANGTGTDGPVAGNTTGAVTLNVEYVTAGQVRGQATGELYLEGNCVVPES